MTGTTFYDPAGVSIIKIKFSALRTRFMSVLTLV